MKLQSVRGFRDIFPPDISKFQRIESVARETFEKFGFEKLETAYLEYEEVFSKSLGADSDIVHKEMFIFTDSKGRKIALRPEGTASVVRAYLEQGFHVKGSEQRFYYIGPMFRHERSQKGRFRQFYQAGIEILGNQGPRVDAETCFILWQIAKKLKIEGLSLEVNSIGDQMCRPKYRDALVAYFEPKKHLLCDDCKNRLATNPLRILDCKNESCRAIAQKSPVILDYLCEPCREHYAGFKKYLGLFQVPFVENPRIVRGLDYYTRTAFELVSKEASYLGELAGGGRYDGLVEVMGGPKTPAVGFALGIDRVAEQIKEELASSKPLVCLIPLGTEAEEFFVRRLNDFQNLNVRILIGEPSRSVKKQLELADKLSASYAIIVGTNELAQGAAILKNLSKREQSELSWEQLLAKLKNL